MSRTLKVTLSLAVAVCTISHAERARAEQAELPGLVLEWSAPPACPQVGAVTAQIRSRAPRVPDARAPVRAVGTVISSASGYTLELRTTERGDVGRRELHSASCEELARAAAILLTLLLEPGAREPVDAPPRSVSAPEPAPAPRQPVRARRLPTARLRLGWSASGGVLPGLGTGPLAGIELGGDAWELRADVAWALRREVSSEEQSSVGARIDQGHLAPGGCWGARVGAVRVGPCVGVQLGLMRAQAFGVERSDPVTVPWVAPELTLALRARPRRARLSFEVGGGLPATRPAFDVVPHATVFQPASAFGVARLVAVLKIP